MDAFEWNKVAGAVLASLLLIFVIREVASAFYHVEEPKTAAFEIEVPDEAGHGHGDKPAKAEVNIATLLASADPAKGKRGAAKCISCHTFEKDGATKTGPNLWGIVGRPVASVAGFSYSAALSGLGGAWGFEELNGYLKDPKKYAPGTAMGFAGLKKDGQRADMIAYLRTLADSPLPLPEPPAAADGAGHAG